MIENLQLGEVLPVIDFMKNYNHQATDEPQSAHWGRMQSTMHPVIAYYKCGCGKTMTDKMIHFTSDLKHNAYAVEEFERKMIDHRKLKNIMLKCIYEYSDNCPSQYKSRIPFRILSKSTIPIIRNYFCEKHGKSAADCLTGRTSQFLYTAVFAKKEDLPDAASLYRFCKQHWKEKNEIGACKHYERNFFLTTEIARPTDVTTNILPGTRQIRSIRRVGMEGIVEVRESSYFCINCRGGCCVCKNKYLVLPWQKKNLLGSIDTENIRHHWQDVYKHDGLEEKPEPQEKKHPPSCKRSKSQDNCPEITLSVKDGKHDVTLQKIVKKQQHKDKRSITVVKNTQGRNRDV